MLSTTYELRNKKVGLTKRISTGNSRPSRNRNAENELAKLQSLQHFHDENYHQDIWCLPFNDRIKHMVLHFSKYTGKFILAEEDQDRALLIATLIDTWIITLSSANMLNVMLSSLLKLENANDPNLRRVGRSFITSVFVSSKDPHLMAVCQLGKITGRMAKACESLDHIEAFDSRGTLEKGVFDTAKLCLALAALLNLDLIPLVHARWGEIESKSIF